VQILIWDITAVKFQLFIALCLLLRALAQLSRKCYDAIGSDRLLNSSPSPEGFPAFGELEEVRGTAASTFHQDLEGAAQP
jgi:hypothetical protein